MKTNKPSVHFTDNYLIAPTNPVTVNLIGAGGTGSQVLTALARINHSLIALGHPGLFVSVFDDDVITKANMGRQLFAASEIGMSKAVALINRVNRFFGSNWKAVPYKISMESKELCGNITISCVDTVKARFDIANILKNTSRSHHRDRPIYWMDFGNSQYTGQVVLSTINKIEQPASRKYRTVPTLPLITNEFKILLQDTQEDNLPSCSLAEALVKQDLFINTTLSALGASLLWSMFREGMVSYRGFFLNLKDFRTQPLPVA